MNFNPFRHLTKKSFFKKSLHGRYEDTFQTIFGIYSPFPYKYTLGVADYLMLGIPQASLSLKNYLEKKCSSLYDTKPTLYSSLMFLPKMLAYFTLALLYAFTLLMTGLASFFILPLHGILKLTNYAQTRFSSNDLQPTSKHSSPLAFAPPVINIKEVNYVSTELAAEEIYAATNNNISQQSLFTQPKTAINHLTNSLNQFESIQSGSSTHLDDIHPHPTR